MTWNALRIGKFYVPHSLDSGKVTSLHEHRQDLVTWVGLVILHNDWVRLVPLYIDCVRLVTSYKIWVRLPGDLDGRIRSTAARL